MQIVDLLRETHERGASDLHLTVGAPPVLRLRGELVPLDHPPLVPVDTADLARQLMSPEQEQQLADQGECDFSYSLAGVSRFRVNTYRQRGNVAVAIRLIPHRTPRIDELGLPPVMRSLVERPQGLVVVTGPTGSGKSTTLAALIGHLNETKRLHILTLEDPIEYLHRHQRSIVNQREVGSDTKAFARGLRAALRQDPDVILVGEMRDLETISTAITAAETGHLILTTLHTPDAPQTVDRLIDVFPPEQQRQIRLQVASVLVGVVSQRLLPRADGQGRVAAFEILINTPATANLIRAEKTHQIRNVMQTSRAHGMQTLEVSLEQLHQRGLITSDVVREYTVELQPRGF